MNAEGNPPRAAWRGWLAREQLPPGAHVVLGLVLPALVLAWNLRRVWAYTVDDAYISFRYARNLVDGLGLVYNPGERIEGYTNFLWTLIAAAGMAVGIDPHLLVKCLGAASAFGTLVVVYVSSRRAQPYALLPCVATWLLATSIGFTTHAVLGLETAFFTFLLAAGTAMMLAEHERPAAFPWSGLVFAAAGLTRPDAPLFVGLPMLLLGRGMFARQNLVRALLFAVPVLAHMGWRRAYYDAWLPSTFTAKTGDPVRQWKTGRSYVASWAEHAGPAVLLAFYGVALAVVERRRDLGIYALVAGVGLLYVAVIGGDWMPQPRFCAPIEPYVFVLVCVAARRIFAKGDRAATLALLLLALWSARVRTDHLDAAQTRILKEEKRFWEEASHGTAEWFVRHGVPGRIALGDIGYIGWATNYPIFDLLGLVEPVIARLPGGYTRKTGPGYAERFFEVAPEYAVLVMTGQSCASSRMEGVRKITDDPRFFATYRAVHNVQVLDEGTWCIFVRKDL